ncbi:MAG: phosphoribosyltransferase [Pseudomonadota bacterium]|nr:phosphoribosyltransferase [Campylobacterota bacterium]MEA1921200.1 phosphoribosyltransferase [Pseudomonadota bacterium]
MVKDFRCELISWRRVYLLARKLAYMINDDNFQPEVIVAIARGGYVPARILCDFLDVNILTSIRIEHYLPGANKQRIARLTDPLAIDIKGKNVLVVDDVNDTGETLEVAVHHLKEFSPQDVRVAVLNQKTTSGFRPDYFAHKIIKWRWLIYPWAVMEDINGLLAKLDSPPSTAEKAASVFLEKYRCKVPRQLLEDLFVKMKKG